MTTNNQRQCDSNAHGLQSHCSHHKKVIDDGQRQPDNRDKDNGIDTCYSDIDKTTNNQDQRRQVCTRLGVSRIPDRQGGRVGAKMRKRLRDESSSYMISLLRFFVSSEEHK